MGQLLIKMEGQLKFLLKSVITFGSQLRFVRLKASLVAYDFRELHKKSKLKIIKHGYVKGCQNS
jgi:hypothetical protein